MSLAVLRIVVVPDPDFRLCTLADVQIGMLLAFFPKNVQVDSCTFGDRPSDRDEPGRRSQRQ